MSLFICVVVLLSVLSSSLAGTWTLDTKTTAAVLAGVGAGSDTVASAAAGDNGVGAFVERYSSGSWTKRQVQAGLLLDSATTPSGNTVATSIWTVFRTDGDSYLAVDGLGGACQSANTFGKDKESFALVGTWAIADPNGSKKPLSISGVASSTDGGNSWTISSPVPPGYARYGAFPSDTTWYVSSGIWGSEATLKDQYGFKMSERFSESRSGLKFSEKTFKAGQNVTETGWFGAVSKTTDAGKTWTQVFLTDLDNDILYFNGISCSSETHCIVVGEGYDNAGNSKTAAFVTFDGGANWENTLLTMDVGLMQVKFISENEAWLAGTLKSGRNLYGQFYHTTDGGKTFELEQSLVNCYTIDMDFAETVGFAACVSSSGSSSSVAVYK